MSNQWLRLWHDMPNDPKWRTISRVSKQPISCVISVYIHLLVGASNATERGRTQDCSHEDIATALDMEIENVTAIITAMEGRVVEDFYLTGWNTRQPKREDNSASRAKEWREQQKEERNRTQPNATEPKSRVEADKDKESKKESPLTPKPVDNSKIPEDLDLNDFANACAVLAELLGKKKLAPQDQEVVGLWCSQFDMRNDVFPKIEIAFIKYFSKNKEPPKSAKYFNNMLIEQCKLPYPFAKNLGQKMRTV